MRIPLLDSIPPAQRPIVMIGVPIVAALAITRAVKGKPEVAAATGTIPGITGAAATDAIGVGELSGWMDSWADALFNVQSAVDALENASTSPSSTTPTTPAEDVSTTPAGSTDPTVFYPITEVDGPDPTPVYVESATLPSLATVLSGDLSSAEAATPGYVVFTDKGASEPTTAGSASRRAARTPGSIVVAPRRSTNPMGEMFSAANISRIAKQQASRLAKGKK